MRHHKNNLILQAIALFALLPPLTVPAPAADLSGSYTWKPVSIGAGGFVTGFVTHPLDATVRYCRTDVGNSYRWDNTNSTWVPMIVRNSDGSGIPASDTTAPGVSGCEEIAVDPGNTSIVYISFPVNHSGDSGIANVNNTVYKSTDGGKNFTATGLAVTGGPNGNWRTSTERMKVDPNNSSVIYYGSLQNGLWKSTNSGTAWTNLSTGGVPGITTNVLNVAFYKGGGTVSVGGQTVSKVIYIDEAPNGTNPPASGDVYKSSDGGQTWTNISTGTALSGFPGKITVDQNGILWVAPLNTGSIWKYTGSWTSVAVGLNGGINNVAVDPATASRLFAVGPGGDLARSLDTGATWTVLENQYLFGNTLGWLPQPIAGWRSNAGIYFDKNSTLWSPQGNEGMLTFTPTANNSESPSNPPHWNIVSQGIEEFVTHEVIIPKGLSDKALIAVEDATGIVITNPATYSAKWVNLQPALLSISDGLAWCPNASSYIAYSTDDIYGGTGCSSGYSSDGGTTWTKFASPPTSGAAGAIAISRRGAWGLGSDHIVVLPSNNGLPIYTKNGGSTWTTTTSFPTTDGGLWGYFLKPRQLRADPFTPDKYWVKVYDGPLVVTTDGGMTWTTLNSTLPNATHHGDLETNLNVQNDLWYGDGWEGASAHGLWHSTDGGATWAQNAFFSHAITLCLGAGDGVDAPYTVYVYGADTSNSYGIYRSVNGGSTWDRVSYYPAGIIDEPTAMAGSWDTYGLVYVTFGGNTAVYGKISVVPPPAPTGLTATPGNAQVALSWSASSGATSYNVKRSTVSGSGYATVSSPTTTSYTNTGLTNGTTYYYVVTAVNSGGESANSSQASATPIAPPPAPTGLTATPGNAQAALNWAASSGATSYNVLRSTVSGSGYASVATGIATTSYTNTGLTNGTTYYFVVTATNAGGTSGNSNQASATPASSPPPAPTGLTTSAGNAQALLFWTASTGATSYNVLRSTTSGSGYASIASGLTATFYDNTGLTNGTVYYYVAQALNTGGTSANSAQASASPAAAPQAQTAFASTAPVIDGNVDSIWSTATAYSINNVINTAPGTITSNADLSGTWQSLWDSTNLYLLVTITDDILLQYVTNPWDSDSIELYIDADHSGGTTYDANDFQYAFPWNSTTIVETKHSPASLTGVVFAQTNITGGYRIELKIPWTTLSVTPAANNLVGIDVHINDADTTRGTRDSKRMWNDTTDLAWNNPSLFGTAKLNAGVSPPAAPTALKATAGNTQAAITWTASTGATSYNVLRSTVSGSGYASVSTGITGTTFYNTGLTNGTAYYFVAQAVNVGGTSGNSAQASATPAVAPQAQIAHATTTPVIDGNADAIWSSAPVYSLSNLVGTLPGGANLMATWQGLWDSTNLYVLVTVMDSTLVANTDMTVGDSLEVYIDGDNNKSTTYDANDWQYIFPWNGTTVEEWSGGSLGTNTTGVTFGQVNITGGYRIEAKIPWSTIGVTAVANNLAGIDFGINDSNVTGTRACKIFWNTTADTDWANPGLFGAGKLMP